MASHQQQLLAAWGEFIGRLAVWVWYVTFTFRDDAAADDGLRWQPVAKSGIYSRYQPDPRIGSWEPSSRWRPTSLQLNRCLALAKIEKFFLELQGAAGEPIPWIISEDFGRIGGRWHGHALVGGVSHLDRHTWWLRSFERFGRCKISRFKPGGGAEYYIAKNGVRGEFHFGGTLAGLNLNAAPSGEVGRVVIAQSAAMPSQFFHQTLRRSRRR